jgi:Flp pilus assembly protein TadD
LLATLASAAPRRPEVRFALGFVALRRDDFRLALQEADAALALRPRYPEAKLVRAEALARLGRGFEARQELAALKVDAVPELAAELAAEKDRVERTLRRGSPLLEIK